MITAIECIDRDIDTNRQQALTLLDTLEGELKEIRRRVERDGPPAGYAPANASTTLARIAHHAGVLDALRSAAGYIEGSAR